MVMDFIIQLIVSSLIGVVAGFIGAIAGGGGLISIPLLIFLGLPPQIAIATNKFAGIGLSLGATYKFAKSKKIIWKYVLPFSIIALIGGILGANILVNINKGLLSKTVGIVLLIFLPVIFLKKDMGVKHRKTSDIRKTIGYIFYFASAIYGGFFGGGAFILIAYTLMYFFGFKIIQANATDIIPWLILSISASIIFIIHGIIDFHIGIVLFIGMIFGGYLGAHTAIKKGDKWVKTIFAVIVIISAIKILFF